MMRHPSPTFPSNTVFCVSTSPDGKILNASYYRAAATVQLRNEEAAWTVQSVKQARFLRRTLLDTADTINLGNQPGVVVRWETYVCGVATGVAGKGLAL